MVTLAQADEVVIIKSELWGFCELRYVMYLERFSFQVSFVFADGAQPIAALSNAF